MIVSLVCALGLALAGPAYLSYSSSSARFYLLRPVLFMIQAFPYVLFSALWLWRKGDRALWIGRALSFLMLGSALILYVPMLIAPRSYGGDMIALLFGIICLVTTIALLVLSGIAAVVDWWLGRRRA